MENATKALLIAGGVLVVIILIALGISLLNSTSGTTEQVKSSLSAQEILIFNSQFQQYDGTQRGSAVKSLIRLVQQNNTNVNGIARSVRIAYQPSASGKIETVDSDADQAAYAELISKINVSANYSVIIKTNSEGYVEVAKIIKQENS